MSEDILIRSLVQGDLSIRGDGRTVYGLAVPFDAEATVNDRDGRGNYQEMFRFGAFAKTIRESGTRVKFLRNHDRANGAIGKATLLREDKAGLIGEFRVSKTAVGDETLELVRDGVYDSFSIGFAKVPGKDRDAKGVTERLEVKLREVSTLAFGAYGDAQVAGVRSNFGISDEELERLLALAHDLDTQRREAADGTSLNEPSETPDEPVVGHSLQPPTTFARQVALLIERGLYDPNLRNPSAA